MTNMLTSNMILLQISISEQQISEPGEEGRKAIVCKVFCSEILSSLPPQCTASHCTKRHLNALQAV